LTLRVLLFVALAIAVSLILTSGLILTSIKHHFIEQDADELRVITASIEATLPTAEHDEPPFGDTLATAVSGHHGVYYQVEDSQGRLLFRTPGLEFSRSPETIAVSSSIDAEDLVVWEIGRNHYRAVVTKLATSQEEYRVTAVIDMEFHVQFLNSFRRSLWLIMLGTGVVTLFAAWFGIHQGHLPLRSLSKGMQQIQANRLNVRLDPSDVPVELRELVESFNRMIGRLEGGFERLSHFSSDIAHELRTPLTNLITQTQVGLSKPRDPQEYRELLYSSLEEQERLAKMVADMLWLAKSENDLMNPELSPLDLACEIRELFDYFEALATENNLELVLEGKASTIHGDRALIRRALSNLMSNAIRHTPRGEIIRVRLAEEDNYVSVSVINPGDTIPVKALHRIFDRFYRVDPSRQRHSEGAGLGLAIAKSVIESHGGHIEASSQHGITTFTATLPQ
tara:strand:- start:1007 stop:2365 length:1359 start_codon:yes stop_codon:yes gene_type:complete